MNTIKTQQINPVRRVDFSKIRKFQTGGNSALTNTTAANNWSWDAYNKDVIAKAYQKMIANGAFNADTLNKLFTDYQNLRKNVKYNGAVVKHNDVNPYQTAYHNFHFHGDDNEFFNYFTGVGDTGDNVNTGNFTGDNYYGTMTHNRRANFFTQDEANQMNEIIKSSGYKFEIDNQYTGEDGRNYYKLVKANSSTPRISNTPEEETIISNSATQQSKVPGPLTKKEEFPEYKRNRWTEWKPLTAQAVINAIGDKHSFNALRKPNIPLEEAGLEQAQLTSNYLARTYGQAQANELLHNINEAASNSSDLSTSLDYKNQAYNTVQGQQQKNAELLDSSIQASKAQVQDVANRNNLRQVQVANSNRGKVAAWEAELANLKAKEIATRTSEMSGLINNLKNSRNLYNLNENQEYARYLHYNNEYNQARDKQELQAQYDKVPQKFSDSQQFKAWKAELNKLQDTEYSDLFGDDGNIKSDEDLAAWAEQHSNDALLSKYYKAYQSELETAKSNFYKGLNDIDLKYSKNYIPGFVTNQHLLYSAPRRYLFKGGGNLRWERYMQYHRKVQEDQHKNARESQKLNQKYLSEQLDALNKESLLLLRSIFS